MWGNREEMWGTRTRHPRFEAMKVRAASIKHAANMFSDSFYIDDSPHGSDDLSNLTNDLRHIINRALELEKLMVEYKAERGN